MKPLTKPIKMWAAGDLLPDVLDCYRTKKECAFALRNDGQKRKPVRVLITPIRQSNETMRATSETPNPSNGRPTASNHFQIAP